MPASRQCTSCEEHLQPAAGSGWLASLGSSRVENASLDGAFLTTQALLRRLESPPTVASQRLSSGRRPPWSAGEKRPPQQRKPPFPEAARLESSSGTRSSPAQRRETEPMPGNRTPPPRDRENCESRGNCSKIIRLLRSGSNNVAIRPPSYKSTLQV